MKIIVPTLTPPPKVKLSEQPNGLYLHKGNDGLFSSCIYLRIGDKTFCIDRQGHAVCMATASLVDEYIPIHTLTAEV